MSISDVARLDNFLIYFDQVLVIRWYPKDYSMLEIVYTNAPSLKLNRQEYWNRLADLVPPSLLWYPNNNMWVNDGFICSVEKRWDSKKKTYFLITSVAFYGEIREYGFTDFDELLDSRYVESLNSTFVEKQEIQQLINVELTQDISQTVEVIIEEKLELSGMADIFQDALEG